MVVDAAAAGEALQAAELAALIGERGLGGDDIDLRERLNALHRDRSPRGRDARAMAERWAEIASHPPSPEGGGEEISVGALLALAYPERIAKNRGGGTGAFLLVNGRGANVDRASPLAREPYPRGRRIDRQRSAWPHPVGGADHAWPRSRRASPIASNRRTRSPSTPRT